MKKVFLISLFVIFGLVQMSAQMAVTDPAKWQLIRQDGLLLWKRLHHR